MTLTVPGLILATVWLQYHYLLDAIVGCIFGAIFPFVSDNLTEIGA